jgi:Flp pilus assembly pilin Flp
MSRFWRDEGAQATTEYILILTFIVGMLLILIKQLIQPVFARMRAYLADMIDKKLFPSGKALHQLRFGR